MNIATRIACLKAAADAAPSPNAGKFMLDTALALEGLTVQFNRMAGAVREMLEANPGMTEKGGPLGKLAEEFAKQGLPWISAPRPGSNASTLAQKAQNKTEPANFDTLRVISHAADLLENEAVCLADGHTIDGRWEQARMDDLDRTAKAHHDDMMETVKKLRGVVNVKGDS